MTIPDSRSVLMIAYYFPPSGGGGVQRPAKFTKYLPAFGWRPMVVTTKAGINQLLDQKLYKEIETVEIIRIPSWYEPDKTNNYFLKGIYFILRQLQKIIVSNFTWVIPAVIASNKIIKKEKIDLIWATGNPFGSFFVASILKILTHTPIIIDYRDSWSFSEYDWANGWLTRSCARFWEKLILRIVDHVIVVKPKMIEELISLYPPIKNKITLITNGYDEEDLLVGSNVERNPDEFVLTYTGIMWKQAGHHHPTSLFKAIEILKSDPEIKKKIILQMIGDVDEVYKVLPSQMGLMDNIVFTGYLSHFETLDRQAKSDALILLIENEKGYEESKKFSGIIPGKIFEYIASKVPILAIVPTPGFEADTITQTCTGLIARPGDPRDIALRLKEILLKKFIYNAKEELIQPYSRKHLTKTLVSIFNRIVEVKHGL